MARSFNGTSDQITATIDAVDAGDEWTLFCWVKFDSLATSGDPTDPLIYIETSGGARRQMLAAVYRSGAVRLVAVQDYSTTAARVFSDATFSTDTWYFVAGELRISDDEVFVYRGTLDAPVERLSGLEKYTGAGTQLDGGTDVSICTGLTFGGGGNDWTAATIAMAGVTAARIREIDLERIRQGTRTGVFSFGGGLTTGPATDADIRLLLPLDSPTASQAEDMSGHGNHGTVTGATVAADPPVPMSW